jgi:hypothetical protein
MKTKLLAAVSCLLFFAFTGLAQQAEPPSIDFGEMQQSPITTAQCLCPFASL